MPAKWKGSAGPILSHEEAQYDSENLQYTKRANWFGRSDAIAGLELALQAQGLDYDVRNDGPVYNLTTRIPYTNPDTEAIDQYEISSESTSISIWELPSVADEILRHDASAASPPHYRQKVDDFIETGSVVIDGNSFPLFEVVVRHVQTNKITFPLDSVILRRFRRITRQYARGSTGKMNLDDMKVIYTTAELGLPSDVAFVTPDAPTLPATLVGDFIWGWRKRSSRTEFIGQWVEQSYELIFEQHSLLAFSQANANLIW